jgi:two-component system response regulator BaeR
MGKPKILIVDDDRKITGILSDYLNHENFKTTVLNSGDVVISEIRHNPPDAILLDLMLPGKDGLTLCKEIRSFSKVPILIISAKIDEIDRLLGLEIGADDYICKPFSPREVVARTKAILRRYYPEPVEEQFVAGNLKIDPSGHKAIVGESDLHLTPNEFELLKALVSHPGRVFTRSDLVFKIQGYDSDGDDRAIDSHIKNLRKKMDDVLPGNHIIQTVYGVGYSINVPQSAHSAE